MELGENRLCINEGNYGCSKTSEILLDEDRAGDVVLISILVN